MKVSWDARSTDPPLPDRSVVDGATLAEPVTLVVEQLFVHDRRRQVRIPLLAAQEERFLSHGKGLPNDVVQNWFVLVLVAFNLFGVVSLFFTPDAIRIWTGISTTAKIIVALCVVSLVLRPWLRPPQYPLRWRGRIILRKVHPETAREWQRVAGDAIRIE
ncbi:hypothetical protein ACPPVO_42765 [Dactylosporangium sp. McL0621]|uniref:hypothetical protein n=1 Tax=Dactylosporangium sp. McL0621 TaxID=3415678 RepID=UPI003CE7F858